MNAHCASGYTLNKWLQSVQGYADKGFPNNTEEWELQSPKSLLFLYRVMVLASRISWRTVPSF